MRTAKQKENAKKYYQKNKDKIIKRQKEYHKRNKDERNEYSRGYYKRNREKILEKHRKNPEKGLKAQIRIRIRKIIYLGGKCFQCPVNDFRVLEFHHINKRSEKDRTASWNEIKAGEVQLLCANCHTIEHRNSLFLEVLASFE